MIQMAYISFATRQFKMNADKNINAVLQEAHEHNADNDITGQLIYRSGIFVQLLEGQKEKIELLLGRILLDSKRHENMKVLLKQDMKERVFPEWSMAYKQLDDASMDIVNSIVPWQNLMRTSSNGSDIPSDKIFQLFEELKR